MQFSSQQTLTNPITEALLLLLPTFNQVLVPYSCKYYDDNVKVFDRLLRILEEMAVVVFAEQRGEDVLKKLLQVPQLISFLCTSGLDPDPDRIRIQWGPECESLKSEYKSCSPFKNPFYQFRTGIVTVFFWQNVTLLSMT